MIALNYRDSRPIYEQLKESLRRMILSGAIEKDEKMPSVRELAGELAINPNTIQRAYRELEAEGYVYTVQGRGSFAGDLAEVDAGRKTKLLTEYRQKAAELVKLGVTVEYLKQILDEEAGTND